ncbi:MAG: zinc ribbon domain-containing protein [Ruminococcaceae bacterium]|nr:zinc ribbon domain-containing protein [Oscillospiraceae bacterium]
MYCPNCGKENDVSALYCEKCGTSLQTSETIEQTSNSLCDDEKVLDKSKKKLWIIGIPIIIVVIFFIMSLNFNASDIEYTNNSGTELPVVVKEISIQESFWSGYIDVSFEIENLTGIDFRKATIAVLAWDSEGYPIKLCGMYEMDSNYITYIALENISPYESNKYSYTFEDADIEYMAVFASYCEDFESDTWKNPVMKNFEKNQGKKLNETETYYFTFK